MSVLAIVGAGRGLGAAVARRFGAQGFDVALIARNQTRVSGLAADLAAEGITTGGFVADVRDPESITHTLARIGETMGPIEVLQYSPLPDKTFLRPVLETTAADLVGPVEFSVYGPVAAVRQVLPGMRYLPEGSNPSILFVNGGSAVVPNSAVAGTSIAFAGLSAYAQLLHEVLGAEGIQVSQLVIPGAIVDGDPVKGPEAMAGHLWDLHSRRDRFRHQVQGSD
ncbi:SDR family NAD(P)-dependent oxidoreductase [Modestobacter sp. Leaf380]|uniref:SDR family NAD(P)-dependent oxidoreductase n=1 Tax=Modestobacter sp. Leaf380 TaxID=1736356 RepID=UPI0006F1D090|nr:SDR family NAD(P)-dependent oxidoreductase [Modestobacter sp. Leaf380]KQS65988.1 dehydrogenase [Modestobacter sp. Leaf380]